MRIGMVGLGRMGADMARRLMAAGHEVVAYDVDEDAVRTLDAEGAEGVTSPGALSAALTPPRILWLMVPAGVVGTILDQLREHLVDDDLVVDGGNSHWRDAADRAGHFGRQGIHYVDVGVSGGVWGRERGYCLMVGGDDAAVARLEPVLRTLAPGIEGAARTPGREGPASPAEEGWYHCGPAGAGHFVKMVHNGIEYGIMAAYAEGLSILAAADRGERAGDVGPAPLREPAYYTYDLDLAEIAEVWRRGSVIGSWLLDLTAAALQADPELSDYTGTVSDSGEGRWTVQAAIDIGVPTNVISSALYSRFTSRGKGDFGDRSLSAMRAQFGGHGEIGPKADTRD